MGRYRFIKQITGQGVADPALSRLLALVATDHRVHVCDLLGRSRTRHLVSARAEFVRLANSLGYSYPVIGRALGGRDHTTCVHLAARPH